MKYGFDKIVASVTFEFDSDTNQFCLTNDNTPGIYGIGDTKESAIKEYLSGLGDLILINEKSKNEIRAFA